MTLSFNPLAGSIRFGAVSAKKEELGSDAIEVYVSPENTRAAGLPEDAYDGFDYCSWSTPATGPAKAVYIDGEDREEYERLQGELADAGRTYAVTELTRPGAGSWDGTYDIRSKPGSQEAKQPFEEALTQFKVDLLARLGQA